MTFYEIPFPVNPDWQTDGGPGFDTSISGTDNAHETRIQRRSQGRSVFNAGLQVRTHADVVAVLTHYRRVGGPAGGFRYKDWLDYTSTPEGILWGDAAPPPISFNDQVIGVGDGVTKEFQLVKVYGETSPQHTRTITKPVDGTVVVGLNAAEATSGWTVDTTTGKVSFTTEPALGVVVTAGFEFDVPVRFGEEVDPQLRAVLSDWGSAAIPQIPLVELLDERSIDDRLPMRGASFLTMTADVALNLSKALWVLDPQSSGLKAKLPPIASTEKGGPQIAVQNAGSNSVSLRDYETDTEQFALTAGDSKTLYLGDSALGAAVWYGF